MADSPSQDDYRRCPCKNCKHNTYISPTLIDSHIFKWGMADPPIEEFGELEEEEWSEYGEEQEQVLDSNELPIEIEAIDSPSQEIFNVSNPHLLGSHNINTLTKESSPKLENLQNLASIEMLGPLGSMIDLEDKSLMEPLYEGSSHTSFSANLSILDLQMQHGWSQASLADLLQVLKTEFLPEKNTLPGTVYQAKNKLMKYGLEFETIHACPADCILFRGQYEDLDACPKCGSSRYKCKKATRKIPVKVLRYFPIIPRLLRIFRTPSLAALMGKWQDYKSSDGRVRFPADSVAWKQVEKLLEQGGNDSRHVRFGLAVDGVNPFKKLSTKWTLFPLMLTMYNLPPDLITADSFLWLSMLVPGRKQVSNINTYLEPLVEELQQLWVGIPAYDVSHLEGHRNFTLRAILIWCIHDFKGYGFIAGCVVQGSHACPICGPRLDTRYSKSLKTNLYTGNMRFLPEFHPLRCRAGFTEERVAPMETQVDQWLTWAQESENWLDLERKKAQEKKSMKTKKRPRENLSKFGGAKKSTISIRGPTKIHGIKFKSILFKLPYWSDLNIRHVLDVMHVEKNIAEMVLGFLSGKKDTPGARDEMKAMGIHPHLWLQEKGKETGKKDTPGARDKMKAMGVHPDLLLEKKGKETNSFTKPDAPYVLNEIEWKLFCKVICDIKFPSGYTTSLEPIFGEALKEFSTIKSHTYHILLEYVFPVAIRGLLQKGPRTAVILLGCLFKKICSPVIEMQHMNLFLEEAAITVCLFETYFPPSASKIMLHLVYHVVQQIAICGTVSTRWMYPFEMVFKVLKDLVKNMAKPEANIAKSYLLKETIAHCTDMGMGSRALISKRFLSANVKKYEGVVTLLGKKRKKMLDDIHYQQAQSYVMSNFDALKPWKLMYENRSGITSSVQLSFEAWFPLAIEEALKSGDHQEIMGDEVISVAGGCLRECFHYTSMICNGIKFNTESKDLNLETNNSTISVDYVVGDENNLKPYIGIIKDIIDLDYGTFTFVLVECKWFDSTTMVKDEHGFSLVNTKTMMKMTTTEDQPYVNPEQMQQVTLSIDPLKKGWAVVINLKPKFSVDKMGTFVELSSTDLQVPEDLLHTIEEQ